ncbi:tissue factor pathway inhibitor isoform X1 [Podarcis raffonei]|uniref:tissue factor pathway inhibitor isoform X1 n=1 Tax=Podarcis raffonei TaxID=65483 RepID=UPI002329913B|nr:tissue factor pathway inhibitor isoform X1 [Podarcis raffonei]XP_053216035.1 tissue factor pathway inhibitor isoform X1 [Podarcis raffonei]
MRADVFLAAILYLLSSNGPCHGTAPSEEEEYGEAVGPAWPPLKLGMSICAFKADGGPCKALHVRYHFDIQTRQCEIFNYGGCEGNENNFLTLEECQLKCIVPDVPEKKKRSKSQRGKPPYCLLENDPGICRGLITRYFFNKESMKCEKFQYGGCLGNQNNFHTLKECQDTCEDNLRSANSLQITDMLVSTTNNTTPVVKQESVLLPSLCVMRRDRGLCKANEKRFFYNLTTGKCHPFNYSGCGGNENNFTSRKSCLQMCKKESVLLPSLCVMRRDRGLCKANEKRFFYNLTTGKCHPFSYSGCGGNENNFTSRKSCLQMCKKGFQGRMKIRRKRKKQAKLIDGEIVIERI